MNRRSGFSLLDLLISLTLLSIIGAGLAGALQLGILTFDRTSSLREGADEIQARAQIRRFLMRAIPPNQLTTFPNTLAAKSNELTFVTLVEIQALEGAAALRVHLYQEGTQLVAKYDSLGQSGEVLSSESRLVASDVSDFSLRYYSGDSESGEWLKVWDNPASLPKLVQLSLDTDAHWPEFTVGLIYSD